MLRLRAIPVSAVAVVLAAGISHAALSQRSAVSPTMHAFVHEDSSIGLTFDDGTDVGTQAKTPPTIPPGTYTIRVVDDSHNHNFNLIGPGVTQSTEIGGTVTPTWTVTFQPGSTYRFVCDEHLDFMWGAFQTSGTSSGASSSGGASSGGSTSSGVSSTGKPATTSNTAAVFRGTLVGVVSASGKVTLTLGGKAVSKLTAGHYTFAVTDQDAKSGLVIQSGATKKTLTGVTFVGKHSTLVALTAGRWTFSSSTGKSQASFVVS